MLGPPANVDALLGTGICVGSHGGAQALAVASLIAGTGVEDAALPVTLQGNLGMALLEQIRLQSPALKLGPGLTLRMLFAGIDGSHRSRAVGLQFPGMTKEHGTSLQSQRWSLHIIQTVAIIVAAQATDFLTPLIAQLYVNTSSLVPFHLQF